MLNRSLVLTITLLALLLPGCRQKQELGGRFATPSAPSRMPSPAGRDTPNASDLFLPLTSSESTLATPVATATATPGITATPTLTYPLYQGPPLNRADLGVQVHLHREDISAIMRHLRTLGVGWVKVQISWKLYQPNPEVYSAERFEQLDRLVNAAAAQDIAILLSVSKAPEWSRPTTELDGPPGNYDLYQTFMTHLAARYPDRIAAFELWNEPNLQREWNGSPLSPTDFVRLMEKGAAGVRAAGSPAILISGAPATTGINDGIAAIDDRIFFREMLAAGAADLVDVLGAHPYGWANPPDSQMDRPDPSVPSHQDHPSFFFQDTLLDYANMLSAMGINKPIWVTEFGWGSFDGLNARPPSGAEFMNAVSEWQQAVYTLRAYELAQGWDWLGPLILWNLNFGPLLGEEYSESGYSLLRSDGSRRPVYEALAAADKK